MTTQAAPVTDAPSFPFQREMPLDPPPAFALLRQDQPVTRVRIWDGSTPWLVTRYDDCRRLLRDDRLSNDSDRPGYPHHVAGMVSLRSKKSFATMDPPDHAQHRQLVTADFAVAHIEMLKTRFAEIVDERLDAMAAHGGPVDLVEHLALPVPSAALSVLLGVPTAERDFFQQASKDILSQDSAKARAATEKLWAYLAELLDVKRAEPGDDLVTRLAEHVDAGRLDRDEAVSDVFLLLVAGHETSTNQIALGVLALLEHPDQLPLVLDGKVPMAEALEEIFRYMTIVQSGRRRVLLADVEVDGVLMRAGEGVIVATDSANRDPHTFPEPDRFDVTRNPRNHMAFGFGVHQCVGQRFARAELETTFTHLFARFPTLRLAVPMEELQFNWDAMFYGVKSLAVTW